MGSFESFADFLAMGGDKNVAYIWASYGIFFVFLLANLIAPIFMKKMMLKEERRRRRREEYSNESTS